MFEAQLANAAVLKKVIEAIKDLVTDAPFDCTENSLSLQAMDSSHVSLVALNMHVSMFEKYRCDRAVSLGMSLNSLARAFKCANNDDSCMIMHGANDEDVVVFVFEDTDKGRKQEVTVKMMDIDCEHLGIPEQEYSAVVKMPSSDFQKTCRDLAMFSDTLSITVTKGGVVFSGKGDAGSSVVNFTHCKDADAKDDSAVTVEVKSPVTANFSIKYMNQFTRATSLSPTVRISLCNEVPVVIEYPLEEKSSLRYFLAPKIDDDGDMGD